ncbi:glycosyl transferase family 2 [Halobaculum sp. MBLA0147]|uniref:glycosyl transferase family 2 n=1 Tax=Halobaculum sp. MBLA0147 TaxID=3079934 RepID=UPI0035248D4F
MEYVQERITTLHDLRDATRSVSVDRAAVVVPMTEREYAGLAAERVLSELAALDPGRVIVPLRASAEKVPAFRAWLDDFDLRLETVWCDGPELNDLLERAGVGGPRGKGRDVWLALGAALATDAEHVVVHDADTETYDRGYVRRLLFPLTEADGFSFSKGYYARVENDGLYGRLFRLFYTPLVRTLRERHGDPFLAYLDAFRYALAGEFAATRDVIRGLRVQRQWGLEVGTLADAYDAVGAAGTAQVDLGSYSHDHRAVSGPTGLSEMSQSVGATLLRAVEEHGIDPEYATLPERYRETAEALVRSYATDAAFNDLPYDRAGELEQVGTYADAVAEPGSDTRLPAWADAPVDPEAVVEAATEDLATVE